MNTTTDEILLKDWRTLFQVNLQSNPTTGYAWQVSDKDNVTVVSNSFAQQGSRPGLGSLEAIKMRLRSPRGCVVTLQYKRPWENEVLKEHRVKVTLL